MSKNRNLVATSQASLAVAAAASLIMSNVSIAEEASIPLDTDLGNNDKTTSEDLIAEPIVDSEAKDSTSAALAGFFATTSDIYKDLAEINSSSDIKNTPHIEAYNDGTLLMADVTTRLNIRSNPSKSSEKIGHLRPSDTATIVSESEGWYEITSGEVHGYVSANYVFTGEKARERYDELIQSSITCNVNSLNVRSDATTDSKILNKLSKNETVVIDPEAPPVDGWVGIISDDVKGYVCEDYVNINDVSTLGTAISAEELALNVAKESEAREAALAATQNQVQSTPLPINSLPVATSTDDETLLAALLMAEAGGSYDGMLAVGGVVMNRLHSGYADSIRGVIYQRGQFTPAGSGKVDRIISSGVSDVARQAARDALSGIDITGGCKNFRSASTGHYGTNIGGNVFF